MIGAVNGRGYPLNTGDRQVATGRVAIFRRASLLCMPGTRDLSRHVAGARMVLAVLEHAMMRILGLVRDDLNTCGGEDRS